MATTNLCLIKLKFTNGTFYLLLFSAYTNKCLNNKKLFCFYIVDGRTLELNPGANVELSTMEQVGPCGLYVQGY